jgi:hypothetical protein
MKANRKQGEVESRFASLAERVSVFPLGVVVVLSLTAAKFAAAGAPVNLRSAANFAALVGAAVFLAHGLGHLVGILGFGQALWSLGFRPQQVNGVIHAGDTVARRAEASWAFAYEAPLEQKIA